MKRLLYLLLLLITFVSCNQPKKFKIIFLSSFNDDIVSVWLNDTKVIDDLIVNTMYDLGLSNLYMDFTRKGKDIYVLEMYDEEERLEEYILDVNQLIVKVKINDKIDVFSIDFTKGNYLYFSRRGAPKKLKLEQVFEEYVLD